MARLCCFLVSIVFWNVENCFDYFDGGHSDSDREFSSFGTRHWTKARFTQKTQDIGKTLLWAGSPEIVGLAEVENDFVLRRICSSDVLYKKGYRFVHYESRDRRGIDVALLYLPDSVELVHSRPVALVRDGDTLDTLNTRDILYVCLRSSGTGELWHIFVNHHPSKYGGTKASNEGRLLAMRTLRHQMDSLRNAGERHIVAMGDFNDTPDGEAFGLLGDDWVNLGLQLSRPNEGSIRYRGKWELIDNFIILSDCPYTSGNPYQVNSTNGKNGPRMEILRPSFLLERDRQWPGDKPRRCYVGPRYNGGVSDHLPVRLNVD